jgi:hypothetical protein
VTRTSRADASEKETITTTEEGPRDRRKAQTAVVVLDVAGTSSKLPHCSAGVLVRSRERLR